jgi:hypothetical protein
MEERFRQERGRSTHLAGIERIRWGASDSSVNATENRRASQKALRPALKQTMEKVNDAC